MVAMHRSQRTGLATWSTSRAMNSAPLGDGLRRRALDST